MQIKKKFLIAVAGLALFGTASVKAIIPPEEKNTDSCQIVEIQLIDIQAPEIPEPAKDLQIQLETITVSTGKVATEEITIVSCGKLTAMPVTVPDPEEDLARFSALAAEQKNLFCDKRNIIYDPALNRLDSPCYEAWRKIYLSEQYVNYKMQFKPLLFAEPLRIIAEVWCPSSPNQSQIMRRRVKDYQEFGYNAVLVCFDTSEDLEMLSQAVDQIRQQGMKIIIVYAAGKEDLHESVFRSPIKIKQFLHELAPRADALLLGWWRSSVHLFLPDTAFLNYVVYNARAANPELPIIGQCYFGATAEKSESDFAVTTVLPENSSGVLIIGMGYPEAANQKMLQTLFANVSHSPYKIALVVGEKPYFDTANNTQRSQRFNNKVKRAIENRLLQVGCQGTLTFSGDGSNGIYDKNKTENLCSEYK